jgi:hypothetical protein
MVYVRFFDNSSARSVSPLSLAAVCFTPRRYRDNWSNNNGIHDGDRGGNSGWNSDAWNGNRDHDGRW